MRCNNRNDMRVVLLTPLFAALLWLCPATSLAAESSLRSESEELKSEPKQTRRLFESALRLEKTGQIASAILVYGDVLQKAPNHPNALRRRARLLLQSGHVEAASNDLSALLAAHPDDGAAWATYGDCMRELKREKDAAEAYSKALENGFNNAAVSRKRGDVLAAVGDNDAALQAYSNAIKLRLDDPEAYLARGLHLMKMRRQRDAIDDFTRAIDFNPDYADAYFNRGRAWGDLNQFADAVRDLTVFLRMKPGDGPALGYRGAALDTLGRVDEALADYAAALKSDPANSHVLMARAELYSRLGRHADALADRDRAIALEPLNAYFFMARGATQLALGNSEKALSDRTRAVELAPSNALMWYSRATTYSALGQPDKAESDAHEALRRNPNFDVARKLIEEIQTAKAQGPERVKLATALDPASQHSPKIQPGTPARSATAPTTTSQHPVAVAPVQTKPPAPAVSAPIVPRAPEPVVPRPASPARPEASLATPLNPALRPQVTQAPKPAPITPAVEPVHVPVPKVTERVAPQVRPSAKQLYQDGRTLLRQDELGAASTKLAQAAALDPDDAKIWNALGFCHMRQKKYKESLTALNKAIALDPRYQNAYQNRSAVKKLLGDGSGSARDRIKAKLLAKRHRRDD